MKGMSRQFFRDIKVLEKDHLLYRSYSLLKQLEENHEGYAGACLPGNVAKEKYSDGSGMTDKILEALRRLEEAAIFLQGRVTESIDTVEKMGNECQTIKHKVSSSYATEIITSDLYSLHIALYVYIDRIHDVQFS